MGGVVPAAGSALAFTCGSVADGTAGIVWGADVAPWEASGAAGWAGAGLGSGGMGSANAGSGTAVVLELLFRFLLPRREIPPRREHDQ